MNEAEYHIMAEQEENYWWHKGRRLIIETIGHKFLSHQQQTIADIGCGTGGNFDILKNFGSVDGLDMSESALEYCRAKNTYNNLVHTSADNISAEVYTAITAFDVLEHLDGDEIILNKWMRALKPHGYVFLTVPAYQWLYGPHDRALHHKRRYTRTELLQKIRAAGFTPLYCSYFFFFTFPLLCASRLFSKFKKSAEQQTSYQKTPALLESLFLKFSSVESFVMRHGGMFPFGSSIIVIAQKK